RLPVAALADGGAVGLIIGAAIGRIGDVINGEHWGRPLDAPWAVVYTHPDTLGQPGVPVHLAVGYEMVWNLALFGLLIWMRPRFAGQGLMFWTFVLLYSVGRFWTSFYRLDAQVLFGLTQAQVVAVVGIVLGIVMLAWMLWLRPRPPVGDPIDSENTPRSDEVHSPV
ncbi:MAG TPA: prolipoprotein diacylglyceryl transferase family protein, partial [Kofleriaceae bacterium]|nr:prolipoprotein diacylglyceryl transferase family protein [Kofleriaceae bacterium]